MTKILGSFFFSFFLFHVGLYGGSADVSLSGKEVVRGEAVFLAITTVEKGKSTPLPKIDTIAGVVVDNVIHNKEFEQVQIGGKSVMQHIQTMTLEFRPKKSLTIPPFQFIVDNKSVTTKSLELKVVDRLSQLSSKDDYFSIRMKLEKNQIYMNESLLLKVFFSQKSKVPILKLDYRKPLFKDFFIKQVEREKKYKKGDMTVHELSYLLTAKKSGHLIIPPAYIKVARRNRKLQEGGWYRDTPRWSSLSSSSLNVEVKEIPKDTDLVGNFGLEDTIDTLSVKVNTPVNLEIALKGEGSLLDYKGFNFDIPNVTIYSNDANRSAKVIKGKLQSHYIKQFVFISDHDFTIPSQQIITFDPHTKMIKHLETKSYDIHIDRGVTNSSESLVHTNVVNKLTPKERLLEVKRKVKERVQNLPNYFWMMGTFFLGGLFVWLWRYIPSSFWKKFKSKKLGFSGYEALRVLYPHIGSDSEVEEMVRKLYAIKNGEKKIDLDRQKLKSLVEKYREEGKK